MIALRRLSYLALAVAFAHIVFGAIVRITGSGMGCGDHWPKCNGAWFPPLDRPDLIIEITHRYLALLLLVALVALVASASRRRALPGVAGRGGVLRAAYASLALWFVPALLGAVTVWLGNTAAATVAHKVLALTLLAVLAATVVRAGGFGGASIAEGTVDGRTRRATMAGAVVALIVVGLGALTAKYPGATTACFGFPLCNGRFVPEGAAAHVQMTHRIFAYLFALHVLGMTTGILRRSTSVPLRRVAIAALALVVTQIGLAAAMVLQLFPAPLRSAHQAVGVSIWVAVFLLAYLSRRASHVEARAAPDTHYQAGASPVKQVAS